MNVIFYIKPMDWMARLYRCELDSLPCHGISLATYVAALFLFYRCSLELNHASGIFSHIFNLVFSGLNSIADSLGRLMDNQHQKMESKLVDSCSKGYRLRVLPLRESEKFITQLQDYARELLSVISPASD